MRHRGQKFQNNTILREKKMFKNEYCLEFLALSAFFIALARFSSCYFALIFRTAGVHRDSKAIQLKNRHILKGYHGAMEEVAQRVVGN